MPALGTNIEVSAIMPCLNEEQTIARCIEKAFTCFATLGVRGEVVVGDNGSTDRSAQIAQSLGARVVQESRQGYGLVLKAAIEAASGKYCIMADCDDSYDWGAMGPFIEKLREGCDLVMGTRLKGGILSDAMPPLHQYFGNPFLSGVMNLFFRTGASDAYCGMRGFSRAAYDKMNLQAEGMEFAIEMIIKASNKKMRITEVPVTLYPDGRSRPPHLRSFRDGWRTLRLLLFYAPDFFYVAPGSLLFLSGVALQALLLFGPVKINGVYLGVHWLALGCLFSLLGFQILSLGAFAKAFAMNESFEMRGEIFSRLMNWFTLEAGIVIGAAMMCVGLLVDVAILATWLVRDMGPLGSTHAVFVATTVIALGFQVIFSSFFLGMFRIGTSGKRAAVETTERRVSVAGSSRDDGDFHDKEQR
jgi:glycosyltransferase involved in cell wall biosynthesis